MRKLFFLLACVCVAACNSKRTINTNAAVVVKNPSMTSSVISFNETNDVQPLLVDAPQIFTVKTHTIKKVEAKNGLRVTVDAANLETIDGEPISGDVQVSIKEMTKAKDMIANNCPTVSNGRMLVSDGSYYIGMTSNGKEVRIKNGKSLQMQFPKYGESDMELFFGEKNADGIMNWKPLNKDLHNNYDKIDAAATLTKENNESSWMPQTTTNNLAYYREMSGDNLLKQYEDSIHETRRAYIICHYMKMTQEQIRNTMEAPYKIATNDLSRFNLSFAYRYSKWYADIFVYNSPNSIYYILPDKGDDSVCYYVMAYGKNRKAVPSANTDSINKHNIDLAIDKMTPSETKKGRKIFIPAKMKAVVRYYDPVEITNLGYLNCDHYYDAPEGITPQYTLNIQGTVPDNIGIYMIFRNINSMLLQKVNTDGKNMISLKQALPLNSKIEFLVYSKIDNQFVQCKQTVSVTKDMVIPISFTAVPDEQVKKAFLD